MYQQLVADLEEIEETDHQHEATGCSLREIVQSNISDTTAVIDNQPLKLNGNGTSLSFYGREVAVTNVSTKNSRKLTRLFNELAGQGFVPAPKETPLVLHWGQHGSIITPFIELDDGKTSVFLNAQKYVPNGNSGNNGSKGQQQKEECRKPSAVFVTGTCLFGKHGIAGYTDKGKVLHLTDPAQMKTATNEEYGRVISLDFMDDLHASEIVGPISRQNVLGMANADKVYFNIPVTPYILYARDAIDKGVMDDALLPEWSERIKLRTQELIEYEKNISKAEIIAVDPLYRYFDLAVDKNITLAGLVETMAADDGWWQSHFAANMPERFTDICYASYMKVYYDLMAQEENRLVVAVEDQHEMRILLGLKRQIEDQVLPKPPKGSSIVGLYPFSYIVFPDKNGAADPPFLSNQCGRNDLAEEVLARLPISTWK